VEAVLIALALVLGVGAGYAVENRRRRPRIAEAERQAQRILEDAERQAGAQLKEAQVAAREELLAQRTEQERDLAERRAEMIKAEERLSALQTQVEARAEELARRDQSIADREVHAKALQEELKAARDAELAGLERIAGMTAADGRATLLQRVEQEARTDMAKLVRQIEEEARLDADKRARNILSVAIQRTASGHTAETTVSVVQLPSDDLKGRIIGREGRNIRALENLTGVDVIIDDTPQAVVLSAFDGVRREIARLTIESLIADGRIHPARIEETYYQSKAQIEQQIVQAGEQACFEANVHGLHPELVKILGRLRYRTSYGQNVLKHSIEVAYLSQTIANELGLDGHLARRAGLLHDIGKSMDHEIEGGHPQIGMEFLRKFNESEAVLNACLAHHGDVPATTPYTPLIMAADAISASRPGARRESLERYVKRLRDLEELATGFEGVRQAYAIQAGREVRVIVDAKLVDDRTSAKIARDIAKKIESEMQYPGEIKVTVMREVRTVEYAR